MVRGGEGEIGHCTHWSKASRLPQKNHPPVLTDWGVKSDLSDHDRNSVQGDQVELPGLVTLLVNRIGIQLERGSVSRVGLP